jgi:hypothetical protein
MPDALVIIDMQEDRSVVIVRLTMTRWGFSVRRGPGHA